MNDPMTRRDCLRVFGLSGLTVGLGSVNPTPVAAQNPGESSGFQSSIIASHKVQATQAAATLVEGKVVQPARELPVLAETDVLVVGGGSAGVVAAIAAQRAGASVTLVERYGHFGGLLGSNHGTVTQCYGTGWVSGTGWYVGGLTCWSMGTITNCFWNTQTSTQKTSSGGTGKTTAEMRTAATFLDAGWDFIGETANGTDDIWWIDEGKDYPRLWWELPPAN